MAVSPAENPTARKTVLMLLTNAYDPDPRVRQEALSLLRMNCRVRILAWDRDRKRPAEEQMEGVEVDRIFLQSTHGRGATQIFFYAFLYLKMLWRGWRTSFDAIHCHDLDTLPVGFVLGKLKRRPIVFDAHESFPDMLAGSVHPLIRRALEKLEAFLIRRIDLLITVGEKIRQHFVSRGSRHSVVVGNWKRLEEFSRTPQQNSEARRRLGIPEDATVLVCITQLLKDRKIEEALQAVDASPGVYLIIGGKGVLEEQIVKAAAANSRIIFVGFVSREQISDYTCVADIVYYGADPDNPNVQFSAPNKLYEALAAGRPLITGDFGEIAAVVKEAECGIVLPAYSAAAVRNAIATMQDAAVRRSMAANAKRFGQCFLNWEKGEEVLQREYSKLLHTSLILPARRAPAAPDAVAAAVQPGAEVR